MTKFFGAATAALAAALVSAPAFAQDAEPTYFDGPYISGTIGMGALGQDAGERIVFDTNQDGAYNDTVRTAAGVDAFGAGGGFCSGVSGSPSIATANCTGDNNHLEYSGRIGFDKRTGTNFVVGALFEVSKSDSRDFTTAFSITPASYTFGRKLDYALSLRARAGYAPGEGRGLFYVTGGASYARIDHFFSTTNTANSFTEVRDDKMKWGYQVGGGAELMVTPNIGIGIEYLYNHYKDDSYYVNVGRGSAPATNPFLLTSGATNMRPVEDNLDFHSLRGTVSFHF